MNQSFSPGSQGDDTQPPQRLAAIAILLVGSFCAIHMISQFLRNSVGVIAPDIAFEIALSPEELGILSSVFFLSFAVVQLPLGVAIDRYGPMRCILASLGLAIAGCLMFAAAQSMAVLSLARILMGLGCSSLLIAPLTIYTRWFPARWFATLTGIQLGVGTLGTVLATAPLAYASEMIGWRMSFVLVAVAAAALGLLVAVVGRDHPPGTVVDNTPPRSLVEGFRGLAGIVRVPGFAQVFVMQFFAYASFVSLLGLWGGPFLSDVYGLDLAARGQVLLVLGLAQTVGLLVWGMLDRLIANRKLLVSLGVWSVASLLFLLGAGGDRGLAYVVAIFAALGFVAGYVVVLTAHGRLLFEKEQMGRGISAINMGTIGGAFVMQAVTGAIIGAFDPIGSAEMGRGVWPFAAYRAAFWFLCAALIGAWLVYRRAPKPRL